MTWERKIQHQELTMIYSPGQEGDRKMQQLYVIVSMIVRELEKRASLRKVCRNQIETKNTNL